MRTFPRSASRLFPAVIAHRGLRDEAPENTTPAIERALALGGLAGIEFDVELADVERAGGPVVVHQETMLPDEQFRALLPATRDFIARDWVGSSAIDAIVKHTRIRFHPPEANRILIDGPLNPRLRIGVA